MAKLAHDILTSAILYYSTVQIISPPHGQFSGGNFIIEMTGEGVSLAILGLIKFSTYLLPTILGFFVLSCLNRSVLTRKNWGIFFRKKDFQKTSLQPIFLISFICLSSIIPYVAVGKGSYYFDTNDWYMRYALPLIIPLALLNAKIINLFKFSNNRHKNLQPIFVISIVVLMVNIFFSFNSVSKKLNRDYL